MKAMRPAAAIASTLLATLPLLPLAGCGNFWQNPNGTSTGTTASTTTLTASSSTVAVGISDTLTATVSPTAATGTVTFYNNSVSIGTGTLTSGVATYAASFSAAGTESITATYQGNSTYASSTSTAYSITVTTAAGISVPVSTASAALNRETNLVLDPASPYTLIANLHLHNIAGVALDNGSVQNIDSGGHCVYYSGKVYTAATAQDSSDASNANGVYELSGGGYLAPEGTAGLDCE